MFHQNHTSSFNREFALDSKSVTCQINVIIHVTRTISLLLFVLYFVSLVTATAYVMLSYK